jgi:hypothetical protein
MKIPAGDYGPPNVLTVGTVTTGAPGSQAAASITGQSPAQKLNLTVPEGKVGATGPAIGGLLTTKGDLVVRDATMSVRLPVGETGAALYADSASPTGVAWRVPQLGNLLTPAEAACADHTRLSKGGCSVAAAGGKFTITASGGGMVLLLDRAHVPVQPGQTITVSAMLTNKSQTTSVAVRILFYDASGTPVGDPAYGSTIGAGRSGVSTSTKTAPLAAVNAHIYLCATLTATLVAGEVVEVAQPGYWRGAGGQWAMPGTPITGQGVRTSRPNTDDRLVEVWDGFKWIVTHYDSGWRNIMASVTPGSGTTLNMIRVQRTTSAVNYILSWNQDNSTPPPMQWDAPVGFRTAPNIIDGVHQIWSTTGAVAGRLYTSNGSTVNFQPLPSGLVRAFVSYPTTDTTLPPTSLPGTLITPAP